VENPGLFGGRSLTAGEEDVTGRFPGEYLELKNYTRQASFAAQSATWVEGHGR
jgi:hypothetical protein